MTDISKRAKEMSNDKKQTCKTCGGSKKSDRGNWFCYHCEKKVLSKETHKEGNIRWHNECYSPVIWKASPCPECGDKQPCDDEFVKTARKFLGRKATPRHIIDCYLGDALNIIERLQAEARQSTKAWRIEKRECEKLQAEIERLKSTRKCKCGRDIYFYDYCPRCRENWQS